MVVGRPISVTPMDETDAPASDAEVQRVHEAYREEIRRVYEDNKARFGYERRALVFI
jgi:hypothetical protein